MVEYRYELKFEIAKETAELLKKQLKMVMALDSHSISQEYSYDIRSLYYDDIYSSSLYEKKDGIEFRGKYRIRIYNYSDKIIKLECKHKDENMTYKEECDLTKQQAIQLMNCDYLSVTSENKFLNKFLANAQVQYLKPSVIVDYRRTAFVYPTSSVRITFDENIRAGRYDLDLFDANISTVPVSENVVLEVKCNEFIPEHILRILSSQPKIRLAVSKFALCSCIK